MKGKREKGEGKNGLSREIERGKKNEKELYLYTYHPHRFLFLSYCIIP
jgi:hypothetical protein